MLIYGDSIGPSPWSPIDKAIGPSLCRSPRTSFSRVSDSPALYKVIPHDSMIDRSYIFRILQYIVSESGVRRHLRHTTRASSSMMRMAQRHATT